MNQVARELLIIGGVIIGFAVGTFLGFELPLIAGLVLDPIVPGLFQVSWIACLPAMLGGAFLGAALGGICVAKRPRLFALVLITIVSLHAIGLALLQIFGNALDA